MNANEPANTNPIIITGNELIIPKPHKNIAEKKDKNEAVIIEYSVAVFDLNAKNVTTNIVNIKKYPR